MSKPAPFSCPKCGKGFAKNAWLAKHLNRKTPCEAVVAPSEGKEGFKCGYCNRVYASQAILKNHVQNSCKVALAQSPQRDSKTLEALETKLSHVCAMLEKISGGTAAGTPNVLNSPVNSGTAANSDQVSIYPFTPNKEIFIPVETVVATFTENEKLKQYCSLSTDDQLDAKTSIPYVLETFIDMMKRAHKNPKQRNIYIRPGRADQVMVFVKADEWEIITLVEAIHRLFSCVSGQLTKLVELTPRPETLTMAIQSAASSISLLYRLESDKYDREGKSIMSAYLSNFKPRTGMFAVAQFSPDPAIKETSMPPPKVAAAPAQGPSFAKAPIYPIPPRRDPSTIVNRKMILSRIAAVGEDTPIDGPFIDKLVAAIAAETKQDINADFMSEISRRVYEISSAEEHEDIPAPEKEKAKKVLKQLDDKIAVLVKASAGTSKAKAAVREPVRAPSPDSPEEPWDNWIYKG